MSPEFFYLGLIVACYVLLFGAAMFGAEALLFLVGVITITGNVIVGKVVTLFGFELSPSACLAVCLFWIGSLLTQYYGLRPARRALYYNFSSLIFLTLVGWLTTKLPGGRTPDMDQSMAVLFSFMPSCMMGALLSFGVSYMFAVFVQRKIQKRYNNCLPWPVQTLLVAVANLLDITIFSTVAYGSLHIHLGQLILMTWSTRLVALLFGLPVIILIRRLYKTDKFPINHKSIGCIPMLEQHAPGQSQLNTKLHSE